MKLKTLFVRGAFISLCGLGLSLMLHNSPLIATPPTKAPQSVSACFPKTPPVSRANLVFSVRQSPTNYYLMSSDQSEGGTDLLISVDERSNRCALLHSILACTPCRTEYSRKTNTQPVHKLD